MKIAGNGSAPAASIRSSRRGQGSCRRRRLVFGWRPDSGSIGVYATAAQGVDLDKVEQAIDAVLHDLREKPVTADELERAKKAFIAEFIYESDSQASLARRYGEGLIVGMPIEEINNWPEAVSKVTIQDVQRVAAKYLDIRRSVTGTLIPIAPTAESEVVKPATAKKS